MDSPEHPEEPKGLAFHVHAQYSDSTLDPGPPPRLTPKDGFDDEDEGVARWPELICVYIAIVSDAVVQNVIAPIAAAWVLDIFKIKNVGLYAGLLVGSFSFASAFTSPFFGWWSDIHGRRSLLIAGMLGSGILTLLGGLTDYYWVAFASHFCAGLVDATQTVSFAAIGDLATGQARQVAFGYSKAAPQIAKILTSMIGGFTYGVKPAPIFRGLPGSDDVLLLHLTAFGCCIVTVLLIIIFYREGSNFNTVVAKEHEYSLSLRHASSYGQQHSKLNVIPTDVPRPLHLEKEPTLLNIISSAVRWRDPPTDANEEKINYIDDATTSSGDGLEPALRITRRRPSSSVHFPPPAALSRLSSGISTIIGGLSNAGPGPKPTFVEGLHYVIGKPILLRLILVYSLTSFLNGGAMLSIMLLAQEHNGFGMSPQEASIIMFIFGIYAIVYNFFLFKPVVKKLGPKRANAVGLALTGIGLLGLPLTDQVAGKGYDLWLGISLSIICFGSGYMMVNSILAFLISCRAAAEMQGIAQGVAVFSSQILSGVGPMFQGALFEASVKIGAPHCIFSFNIRVLHSIRYTSPST